MKKRHIALVGILALLVIVLAGCSVTTTSWSGTGLSKSLGSTGWTVSARTVNGHIAGKVSFAADNLAALHVDSANSGGTVTLTLTQGDVKSTVDISGEYNENVDMSDFAPGSIQLRLDFERAEAVKTVVRWK